MLSLFLQTAIAQINFFEDFEQGMPGSFTLHNVDGLTPETNVGYVTNAWVTRPNFDDTSDTVACSTSWYNPVGVSDDWMVTPLIHIDSPATLTWDAKSQDAGFLENYEVRISTAGTGTADFLANAVLFSTAGEQGVWTSRLVSLASKGYKNQDVYIAFRNISNDRFLLLVDDIMVRNAYSTDAKAISLSVPSSSCILGNSETISVTIENYGLNPISNFNVTYVVNDGVNADTVTETISATVQPNATYNYTFTNGADLSSEGTVYTIDAYITLAGDGNNGNNVFQQAVVANVASVAPTDSIPYQTSFETVSDILGWSNEDDNQDGFSWILANGTAVANTGNVGFVYFWNNDATTAANDWLYSTCLDLMPNNIYELSFYYRVGIAGSTVYPEKFEVAFGASPNVAGMTTLLKDAGEVSNVTFEKYNISFIVNTAGVYYIGFHCYSDADDYFLAIDDVKLKKKTPFSLDVKGILLSVPSSSCSLGSAEPISVTIENDGLTPISNFEVSYVINAGANSDTVTETVVATIPFGATYNYTFTQGADLSLAGTTYYIDAFITLAGDSDNTNNILAQEVVSNIASVAPSASNPYNTSFESQSEILGWSNEDVNNDGFTWKLLNGSDYASSGNFGFVYFWNDDGTTPANDWLHSTCVDLIPGKTYLLSFSYRVGYADTVYAEKLKVALGSSPDASSMTTVLEDVGEVANDFFEQKIIHFTVSAAGTYYIGFHCYSDANDYYLALDDLRVDELLAPVAGFTTGKNELQVTFLSTSTGIVDSLYWDFGDGNVSSANPSVVHTFASPGSYYTCLTAFNTVGSDTFCQIVTVDTLSSGISILNNVQLKIYPNPTNGLVVIEAGEVLDDAEIIVNDLLGKELLREKISSQKTSVNLSSQPEGIYFVTVKSGVSRIREKMVLTR